MTRPRRETREGPVPGALHLLRTPCPVGALTVWCGRYHAELPGADDVTGDVDRVTCPGCINVMAHEARRLASWRGAP